MRKRFCVGWQVGALIMTTVLTLTAGTLCAQSDSAVTPDAAPGESSAQKSWSTPFVSPTNAASASFLDSHPELEQPPPPVTTTSPVPPDSSAEKPTEPSPAGNLFSFPEGTPDELGQHLLVVYNSTDPASKELAEYYAGRRSIPAERVLGIACPTDEQITRKQYDDTVREPIISYIFDQHWMDRRSESIEIGGVVHQVLLATRNNIWAIVLMRGVPLRIANDPTLEGTMENAPMLQTNAAAVDSELALLPVFGLPAGGFVPNIFFDRAGLGLIRAGPELATKLILVTRLDGPRPADVRRMIDDSIYAEQNRLAGLAVIDSRGLVHGINNYAIGDDWLRSAQEMLQHDGWTVKFDARPEVLPPGDPLNHVAIYLGWYHDGACGPWITGPNRFARGAIAYHLHSFSATTVRSPTAGWVGPLIAHGAAATMGCVYEPFLDLTPHLDVFMKRLVRGNSFAEAAYASEPGLSWMVTAVGDPLYRPFNKSVDAALAANNETASDHYGWLLLQQVKRGIDRRDITPDVPTLRRYLDVPGGVAQEGLGDSLAKLGEAAAQDAAILAYREAGTLDDQPLDKIRVGLKLAQVYLREGKGSDAVSEFDTLRELYPNDSATFGVPPSEIKPVGAQSSVAVMHPASSLNAPQAPRPPQPVKTNEEQP